MIDVVVAVMEDGDKQMVYTVFFLQLPISHAWNSIAQKYQNEQMYGTSSHAEKVVSACTVLHACQL